MAKAVFGAIEALLKEHGAQYRVLEHEASGLSSEVSKVREKLTGISAADLMKMAVKSMILVAEGKFYQFNLAADRKIDFTAVKAILGMPARFATPEDVKKVTECDVGEVQPFGNLFKLPVYADTSISSEEILFNAGMLTKTIFMQRKDWLEIVKPVVTQFIKE